MGAAAYAPDRRFVVHSPGSSAFLGEMTLWPPSQKRGVKSKIRPRQSMRIFTKNFPVKFYPDPIWNDGVLGYLKESHQQEQQEEEEEQEE